MINNFSTDLHHKISKCCADQAHQYLLWITQDMPAAGRSCPFVKALENNDKNVKRKLVSFSLIIVMSSPPTLAAASCPAPHLRIANLTPTPQPYDFKKNNSRVFLQFLGQGGTAKYNWNPLPFQFNSLIIKDNLPSGPMERWNRKALYARRAWARNYSVP